MYQFEFLKDFFTEFNQINSNFFSLFFCGMYVVCFLLIRLPNSSSDLDVTADVRQSVNTAETILEDESSHPAQPVSATGPGSSYTWRIDLLKTQPFWTGKQGQTYFPFYFQLFILHCYNTTLWVVSFLLLYSVQDGLLAYRKCFWAALSPNCCFSLVSSIVRND